ncbi:di-heme oxidoredictase family protein [Roseibium sp.]|uniref:di-heme oxidoreductase family protein n=1 Tax=Roseibium sp. TaxID=1936156 RepID=UPI003D115C05
MEMGFFPKKAAAGAVVACLSAGPVLAGDSLAHRGDLSAAERAKVARVLQEPADFERAEAFEFMQGGAGTSKRRPDRDAFSRSNSNIGFEEEQTFKLGNGLFKKLWTSSPSSTQASDGLGPLFNARSCQGCHPKDGRGRPPLAGEEAVSLFLRLSVPPQTEAQRRALAAGDMLAVPEPTYGGQLQSFAVSGLAAEGRFDIGFEEIEVPLNGEAAVVLKKPVYNVRDLGYGSFAAGTMISPRVAPPMIGLGLLQAIHPGDIEMLADPEDRDGDGISGKISQVRDPATGTSAIGRFGWKASTPTVRAQTAAAFSGDIGISTPERPDNSGDCTEAQQECRGRPHGEQARLGVSEAPDPVMDLVTFYSENLAVPMRRNADDAEVLEGKQVFYEAGCPACHQPKFVTSRNAANPAHRYQLIWPYSDLLLHDMGEDLADHRPVGSANGREWRTPPLWGIGLTETVNNHTRFLHDGRARNLLEAVLWHGGEARAARDRVAALSPDDRRSLVRFLESL